MQKVDTSRRRRPASHGPVRGDRHPAALHSIGASSTTPRMTILAPAFGQALPSPSHSLQLAEEERTSRPASAGWTSAELRLKPWCSSLIYVVHSRKRLLLTRCCGPPWSRARRHSVKSFPWKRLGKQTAGSTAAGRQAGRERWRAELAKALGDAQIPFCSECRFNKARKGSTKAWILHSQF